MGWGLRVVHVKRPPLPGAAAGANLAEEKTVLPDQNVRFTEAIQVLAFMSLVVPLPARLG